MKLKKNVGTVHVASMSFHSCLILFLGLVNDNKNRETDFSPNKLPLGLFTCTAATPVF